MRSWRRCWRTRSRNRVEGAYSRTGQFERLRRLMNERSEYLAGRIAGSGPGPAAGCDGGRGRFRAFHAHFGKASGRRIAQEPTISDPRGVRVGWKPGRAATSTVVARARRRARVVLAVREADDRLCSLDPRQVPRHYAQDRGRGVRRDGYVCRKCGRQGRAPAPPALKPACMSGTIGPARSGHHSAFHDARTRSSNPLGKPNSSWERLK